MAKRAVLLVAVSALVVVAAAFPALAREGDAAVEQYGSDQYGAGGVEGDGGGETVRVVLELEISGEVPGWQTFWADSVPRGQSVGASFCSSDADFAAGGAWPLCEPGVHSAAVEVPAGVPTEIEFVRQDGNSGAVEVFHSEVVTATEDATVAARYGFPGAAQPEPGGVFRFVLDGEAPEGYRFWLRDVSGVLGTDPQAPICSTVSGDGMFPECSDGGGANELPFVWPAGSEGSGFAYEVVMADAATGAESVVASGAEAMVEGVVIEARHGFADEAPQGTTDEEAVITPKAPAAGTPIADAPGGDALGGDTPETINVSLGGLLGHLDGDGSEREAASGEVATEGVATWGVAAEGAVRGRVLPATGGTALLALGVGVLLVAGGDAFRRLVR